MKKVIFTLLLLLMFCADAFCASGAGSNDRPGQPINIKSNELYTDSNARTATFVGKVVAKQKDMTIYSDKLVIKNGNYLFFNGMTICVLTKNVSEPYIIHPDIVISNGAEFLDNNLSKAVQYQLECDHFPAG